MSPAEKFVLEKIKGVKADEPSKNGDVVWRNKYGSVFVEKQAKQLLIVSNKNICRRLSEEYTLSYDEIQQLLTKLLYKYTNKGQLEVI